jgi:AcrR family transcriptional regulator
MDPDELMTAALKIGTPDDAVGHPDSYSPRQRDVLEAALGLLVEGGDRALTTTALARTANCSKESIYKWFGDREGLLSAIVTHQASKVRNIDQDALPQGRAAFEAALRAFAEDLLTVLMSDTSLALNRLSIGAVRGEDAGLGAVLLERGKRRIETRALVLLEAGRSAGHLSFDTADAAYQALYGLIIGDRHVRALLGDAPDAAAIPGIATSAITQFLALFGAEDAST